MNALYFGPAAKRLFGYMHVPAGNPTRAAVLCAPYGAEYQNSHRTIRFLAKRLSSSGFQVLRFDYAGTGDSWGDSIEADFVAWTEDVRAAVNEVRQSSGVGEVDLVGLRLGATVAARAAAGDPGIRRLVLWDPVVDGKAWLGEVGAARLTGRGFEVANALVAEPFVQEVQAIDSDSFPGSLPGRQLVLLTQEQPDATPWRDAPSVAVEILPQPAPWIEDESIWTGQVPVEAVNRIVEWLR